MYLSVVASPDECRNSSAHVVVAMQAPPKTVERVLSRASPIVHRVVTLIRTRVSFLAARERQAPRRGASAVTTIPQHARSLEPEHLSRCGAAFFALART